MKKLAIAAVAVLAGMSVFAGDDCGTKCAWGYKVKVILKTTTAQNVSNATTCVAGCFRKPTTKRYIGYFFGATSAVPGTCGPDSCGCNDWSAGNLVFWDYDTKKAITQTTTIKQLNRIGYADTKNAEIVYTVAPVSASDTSVVGDLTFAGFGVCGRRADGTVALKSANGFVAGRIPGLCSSCDEVCGVVDPSTCVATPANVWSICTIGTSASTTLAAVDMTSKLTAAYGKWAMAWDAEIVDRITTGKTVLDDTGVATAGYTPAGFTASADAVVAPTLDLDLEEGGLTTDEP